MIFMILVFLVTLFMVAFIVHGFQGLTINEKWWFTKKLVYGIILSTVAATILAAIVVTF